MRTKEIKEVLNELDEAIEMRADLYRKYDYNEVLEIE